MCNSPGRGDQCLHELHVLLYRGLLAEQGRYVRDLERRLDGDLVVTQVWLDGVLQVTPVQVAAAKLRVEMAEESGEEVDEGVRAVAAARI